MWVPQWVLSVYWTAAMLPVERDAAVARYAQQGPVVVMAGQLGLRGIASEVGVRQPPPPPSSSVTVQPGHRQAGADGYAVLADEDNNFPPMEVSEQGKQAGEDDDGDSDETMSNDIR